MSSLTTRFEQLRKELGERRVYESRGDDPVFYLVFDPGQILDVKRRTQEWVIKLQHDGWNVHRISITEQIQDILGSHPNRELWLDESEVDEEARALLTQSISKALAGDDGLEKRLKSALDHANSLEKGLLLVTDLESLHPFLRIGALEAKLQGSFKVPMVILYPGKREGEFSLSFLGIHEQDPHYRSRHIGD